jgi:hypothetical protein
MKFLRQIYLSEESRAVIRSKYPSPNGFITIADHVTICLGSIAQFRLKLETSDSSEKTPDGESDVGKLQAIKPAILHKLEVGCRVEFVATHFGKIEAQIAALKVNGVTSSNQIPHITLSRDPSTPSSTSNSITEWKAIKHIPLWGTIREETRIGDKNVRKPPQVKREVSIGTLVKQINPELQGKHIGAAVRNVQIWMLENGIANSETNRELIDSYLRLLFHPKQ